METETRFYVGGRGQVTVPAESRVGLPLLTTCAVSCLVGGAGTPAPFTWITVLFISPANTQGQYDKTRRVEEANCRPNCSHKRSGRRKDSANVQNKEQRTHFGL